MDMAAYIARQIYSGNVTYTKVFSISLYLPYKEEVDAILILEGYEHLIVPIV